MAVYRGVKRSQSNLDRAVLPGCSAQTQPPLLRNARTSSAQGLAIHAHTFPAVDNNSRIST
eukprot:365011-Chlamydomonas_euryale.AAC.24